MPKAEPSRKAATPSGREHTVALSVERGALLQMSAIPRKGVIWSALSLLLLTGILARLRALLVGRSLWVDEVSLAVSIRDQRLIELLTEPLAFGQSAPPGFLLLSKISEAIFGSGLTSIRAVPFISGVAALVVAALFTRRAFTAPAAQLGFVAGVGLSPTLVYYSAEMKQYSTDALAVMLALYLSTRMGSERLRVIAATVGFLAVVGSLPGVVVFGILALLLLGSEFSTSGISGVVREIRSRWSVYLAWSAGALVHGLYTLVAGTDQAAMRAWWDDREGFPPDIVGSAADLAWYFERFVELLWLSFENTRMAGPGAGQLQTLSLVASVVLLAIALRGSRGSSLTNRLLGSTVVAAWLMAEVGLYPLSSRLAIYLIPVTLGLLAIGIDVGLRSAVVGERMVAALAALIIAGNVAPVAFRQAQSPYVERDMNRALQILQQELAVGDAVVTNPLGERIIDWHRTEQGFVATVEVIDPGRMQEDLDGRLFDEERPDRVWVVTTHRPHEGAEIAAALATEYRYLLEFKNDGTYLALLSDRVTTAFVETGDRRLLEVVTVEAE